MANEFFTILTAAGRAKLANATATGNPLTLTHMAVGSGNAGAYYSPTEAQAALKTEVWRGAINHLAVDASNPTWIVAELVIPDDVGGFYIREVGLFDSAGALIAVGKFPESYKPTLEAGSNKQLYVRMILEVANTAAVTLLVDPSVVLATRKYADDKIADELNKRDGKQSVRAATTAAIVLAGLQAIDGVALAAGERVLVKDQAAGEQNGIYVAAAGNWTRAADADSGAKLNAGALVPVEAGTVNAETVWMLKTDGAIVVGATPIAFQWAGGLNAPKQVAGDASAKVASTSFVQNALGNVRHLSGLNAPANLVAADAGKAFGVNIGGQINLPLAGEVVIGGALMFIANTSGVVIAPTGGNNLFTGSGAVASITLNEGDTLSVLCDGLNWYAFAGSAQLKNSAAFSASLGANGYQKLPSGLILQWGAASGSSGDITLPITFPNRALAMTANPTAGTTMITNSIVFSITGTAQSTVGFWTGVEGAVFSWIAIGI